MPKVHVLDVIFQDQEEAIATYLIETSAGPVLIEAGPESTFPALEKAINAKGYQVTDIQHVFLTHIHFDHAGAAWKFAAQGAKIYVHPAGLPHLNAPEKLWSSAKQIYGDQMETLWGDMQPIPLEQLVAADDQDVFEIGDLKLKVIYTPGHAVHHNAYKLGDDIFTGDVAGVKIEQGPVVAPCPPPDINIALWKGSIAKLRAENPKGLYLTHFDYHSDPEAHFDALEIVLDEWADFIKPFYDQQTPSEEIVPEFMAYIKEGYEAAGLSEKLQKIYEYANPSWMSVNGLLRYWKLKEQGRI